MVKAVLVFLKFEEHFYSLAAHAIASLEAHKETILSGFSDQTVSGDGELTIKVADTSIDSRHSR